MSIIDEVPTKWRISVYDVFEFFGGGGILFSVTERFGCSVKIRILINSKMFYMPVRGDYCDVIGVLGKYIGNNGIEVIQINALSCVELDPSLGSQRSPLKYFLQHHSRFREINVGLKKLDRFFDAFPTEQIIRILKTGDISALMSVQGFTASTAKHAIDAWHICAEEREIGSFLVSINIDRCLAAKVIRLWPNDTILAFKRDPFLLLELTDWLTVDRIANDMHIAHDDDRRLCARVRAVVYERLVNGHTLTPWSTLLLLSELPMDKFLRGITLALASRYIFGDKKHGYQSSVVFVIEERVRDFLSRMWQYRSVQNEVSKRTYLSRADVENYLDEYVGVEIAAGRLDNRGLTSSQRECIVRATTRPFSVIVGNSGTGKKTIVKAIQYIENCLGGTICHLVAADRGVRQNTSAIDDNGRWIEAFLLENNNPETPLQISSDTTLMISEASMMDLATAYTLTRRITTPARLVLIGDDHHIPPLNYGLFFHKLTSSTTFSIRLNEVFGNGNCYDIPNVAREIIKGNVPVLPNYSNQTGNVSFIECGEQDIILSIDDFLKKSGLSIGSVQIFAYQQKLLHAINNHYQKQSCVIAFSDGRLIDRAKMAFGNRRQYVIDDPVIYIKKNLDRHLGEGSIGKITGLRRIKGTLIAECDFGGIVHEIPRAEMGANIDLAYAIPIHKNCGCAFPISIIVITASSPIIDNVVLYTALTRTAHQAILMGSREQFKQIVQKQKTAVTREVGFRI